MVQSAPSSDVAKTALAARVTRESADAWIMAHPIDGCGTAAMKAAGRFSGGCRKIHQPASLWKDFLLTIVIQREIVQGLSAGGVK